MSKEMRDSEMLQRSKVQKWQLNLSRVLTLLQPSITSRCSFLVSIISASFVPVSGSIMKAHKDGVRPRHDYDCLKQEVSSGGVSDAVEFYKEMAFVK